MIYKIQIVAMTGDYMHNLHFTYLSLACYCKHCVERDLAGKRWNGTGWNAVGWLAGKRWNGTGWNAVG